MRQALLLEMGMDFKKIAATTPDYRHFLFVAEQRASAQRWFAAHPDLASFCEVGETRNKEPYPLISIHHGDGLPNAFLFGAPHPNEPFGCMTPECFARRLCEDENLRARLGYNLHIIQCSDADHMRLNVRLNEGWFRGAYTLRHVHRNFYRRRPREQVEWSFPVQYKTLTFD